MNTQVTDDRRKHTRVSVSRPCKLYHRATGRYLPARTCDVSASGALVRVTAPRPLVPGDEIEVYIAWSSRSLLTTSEQVRGRVTRTMFEGNDQIVGVEFVAARAQAAQPVAA